jgi:hypothetical protein
MDARVSSANVRRSVSQVEVWKADEREHSAQRTKGRERASVVLGGGPIGLVANLCARGRSVTQARATGSSASYRRWISLLLKR